MNLPDIVLIYICGRKFHMYFIDDMKMIRKIGSKNEKKKFDF